MWIRKGNALYNLDYVQNIYIENFNHLALAAPDNKINELFFVNEDINKSFQAIIGGLASGKDFIDITVK